MPRVAINSAYPPFGRRFACAQHDTDIIYPYSNHRVCHDPQGVSQRQLCHIACTNAHKSVKTAHNAGMKKYDDISEVEKMLSSAEPSEVGNLLSELIRLTNTK